LIGPKIGPIPMRYKFLKWRGAKARPDVWQLGRDARDVIQARISLALSGRLSAHEARRMVMEKQSAAVRAQLAYMQELAAGKPGAASQAAFDIYDQAVRSNRKRLVRRRWWATMLLKSGRKGR
jgi:hypothetical protein